MKTKKFKPVIWYEYIITGKMKFQVLKRWVDKEGKPHLTEYNVFFNKKVWRCDPKCKGYTMSKKPKICKHIKFVISQLKDKDWGILRDKSKFDWDFYLGFKE